MDCRIDHITVVAPTLDAGARWVHERLGVWPQAGGKHARMGTHNLLLRLGNAVYLEVIAVDPLAAKPMRPRWFALDELGPGEAPRLACWVIRTEDIQQSLGRAPESLGIAEPMSRGALQWSISIPEDGHLPLGGVAPALIQWLEARHPAQGMQDAGCTLVGLELRHPDPERVRRLLDALSLVEPGVRVSVEEGAGPALVAHVATPAGLRSIGAPGPLQGP